VYRGRRGRRQRVETRGKAGQGGGAGPEGEGRRGGGAGEDQSKGGAQRRGRSGLLTTRGRLLPLPGNAPRGPWQCLPPLHLAARPAAMPCQLLWAGGGQAREAGGSEGGQGEGGRGVQGRESWTPGLGARHEDWECMSNEDRGSQQEASTGTRVQGMQRTCRLRCSCDCRPRNLASPSLRM